MILQDKRILITGGSGFLGTQVVRHLRRQGCQRLIVPTHSQCDLIDRSSIHAILKQHCPEVVVHLAAAVGGIGANRKHPGMFLYKNLMMGVQLIEECRQRGVEKFLAVGTICSYPKNTPVPFLEADLWNGYPEETNAPYGLAKKMLIEQLSAYHREFGFPGVNVLLVNVFGPGDNFDLERSHVIPALIRKCLEAKAANQKTLTVWGTGAPTREFLFVEDAARAVVLAAEHLESPEPVNIGTGREISIRALAELIASKTGFRGELRFDSSMPDGQPRRCLDVSRSRQLLGFESAVSLEEGLEKTIAWYRNAFDQPLRRVA